MYVVKAISEKIGKVDSKPFARALRGATNRVKDTPGVLLDVHVDNNGDSIARVSWSRSSTASRW